MKQKVGDKDPGRDWEYDINVFSWFELVRGWMFI